MPYSQWQPGTVISSPVYLDASFLVAAFVTNEPRYNKAVVILGELIASQADIVISALTVSESLWAIAKLSYCEIYNHRSGVTWNKGIFQKHREEIFRKYSPRMNAIHEMVRDWTQAGIRIEVMPSRVSELQQIAQAAPEYMRTLQLASADAVHLATAESSARSIITVDNDFRVVTSLQIVHVT